MTEGHPLDALAHTYCRAALESLGWVSEALDDDDVAAVVDELRALGWTVVPPAEGGQ